jgi:hypothetical protein
MPVAGWHDFGEAAPALRFSTLQRQLPSRLDQHQALRLWQ